MFSRLLGRRQPPVGAQIPDHAAPTELWRERGRVGAINMALLTELDQPLLLEHGSLNFRRAGRVSDIAATGVLPSRGSFGAAGGRTPPKAEAGVALVITLILLAVITFMAVTFLVVSRTEKGAVNQTSEQTMAEGAANGGTEMALAQMLSTSIAFTNQFSSGLLVSTNFINAMGFQKNIGSITNASYNYPDGTFVTGNDFLQNQVNQMILPRPPVFVSTNRSGNFPLEFRYYLDLNRNGRYDTNGLLPVINPAGGFYDTNGNQMAAIIPGNTISNSLVGDPEWVGILEKPGFPHSATNRN